MVRKNTKNKKKKPAAPPAPSPERRQSDIFDEMFGEEVSPDKATPVNVSSTARTVQDFSLLRASTSPRYLLNREAVTGSTSTVPNTTYTSSAMASNQSFRSITEGSTTAEPDKMNSESSENYTTDFTNNVTQAQSGASKRKSQPGKQKQIPSERKAVTRSVSRAVETINKLQTTTNLLIPKLPFSRLIREILLGYCHRNLRITPESLVCLQEASEIYAVQLMEDAYRCTCHRDRATLTPKDMRLALMLRKDSVLL